jgi:hypothetical protein
VAEHFKIETFKGFNGTVRFRVTAKTGYLGPSSDLKIAGDLTPEAALELAEAIKAVASDVAARNAKRAAEDDRRKARMAKLPSISWR